MNLTTILRDTMAALLQRPVTVRYPAELRDGETVRRIDLTLTPIRDESGKVVYILPEGREMTG